MANLLYIEASPLKDGSHSIAAARDFLSAYRERHPDHIIDTIDVWDIDLPQFDATMIGAKFAVLRKQNATAEQAELWERAVAISRRFNAADTYLFSLPMWNFGIPYRLKHFIDVVTLPGQNWSWSRDEGYRPLLKDKRAVLVYSSASEHTDDTDFQKPYMRQWLRFVGIDVVDEIVVAPTLSSPEALAALKREAGMKAGAAETVEALCSSPMA
ncbi:MAG TPA: NAD(P)H-dependent oxidoreductase [Noviherbaspirillum sp.]|nr:NAD(P)H-dependent oxidoreductase [Noviherbaspirillum sp.]